MIMPTFKLQTNLLKDLKEEKSEHHIISACGSCYCSDLVLFVLFFIFHDCTSLTGGEISNLNECQVSSNKTPLLFRVVHQT
jgi:hypothetical protein